MARRTPLSGLYVLMPLISPMVPMDIRSSISSVCVKYFLMIWATSLRLCSTKMFRLSISPCIQRSRCSCSSSRLRGFGKESPGTMRSISRKLFISSKKAVSSIFSPRHILFTHRVSRFDGQEFPFPQSLFIRAVLKNLPHNLYN